jgi:hypothetical protein
MIARFQNHLNMLRNVVAVPEAPAWVVPIIGHVGPIWAIQNAPNMGPTWIQYGLHMGPIMVPLLEHIWAPMGPNMGPNIWAHYGLKGDPSGTYKGRVGR